MQPVTVNVGAPKCLTASAFPCHSALVSSIQRLIFPLHPPPPPHLMCVSVLFMFLVGEKNHGDLVVRPAVQLVILREMNEGV